MGERLVAMDVDGLVAYARSLGLPVEQWQVDRLRQMFGTRAEATAYANGVAPPDERWFTFTFGSGHRLRSTNRDGSRVGTGIGLPLAHRFVRVPGRDEMQARRRMAHVFGQVWSAVYPSDAAAGVEAFGLVELELPAAVLAEAAAAVQAQDNRPLSSGQNANMVLVDEGRTWPVTSPYNPCYQADACVSSLACAQYHEYRSGCARPSTEENPS